LQIANSIHNWIVCFSFVVRHRHAIIYKFPKSCQENGRLEPLTP
jgi:hypothetical protein